MDAILAEHKEGRTRDYIVKLSFPGALLTNFEHSDYVNLRTDEMEMASQSIDIPTYETAHGSDAAFTANIAALKTMSSDDASI